MQIQYAYGLLTNPVWKRDYDLYGIDESLVTSYFCFFIHDVHKERFLLTFFFFWENQLLDLMVAAYYRGA